MNLIHFNDMNSILTKSIGFFWKSRRRQSESSSILLMLIYVPVALLFLLMTNTHYFALALRGGTSNLYRSRTTLFVHHLKDRLIQCHSLQPQSQPQRQQILETLFRLGSHRSSIQSSNYIIDQQRQRLVAYGLNNWSQQHRQSLSTLSLSKAKSNDVKEEKSSKSAVATRTAKAAGASSFFLVIVESPSKCSTIEKILNGYVADNNLAYSFKVISCMGHIRNLIDGKEDKNRRQLTSSSTVGPKSKGSTTVFPYSIPGIDLESGQYTPIYTIDRKKQSVVNDLQRELSRPGCIGLLLATDPDREGEAMAWHLSDVLGGLKDNGNTKKKSKAQSIDYMRIRFTEITPDAIIAAVQPVIASNSNVKYDNNDDNPLRNTNINYNLVRAQETRRVLDRLAGFTVSPLLWKKISPGLSAGRVQSVGMALVVQRERERLQFEKSEYFTIQAQFTDTASQKTFPAKLQSVNGKAVVNTGKDFTNKAGELRSEAIAKLHLKSELDTIGLCTKIQDPSIDWLVGEIKSTQRSNRPPIPYKTSTLQQEGSRALNGLSVKEVMRIAQQLYEQGLISYMRTDSTTLSETAVSAVKAAITTKYGSSSIGPFDMVGGNKKKKKKSIEEAHEAIRPAIQASGSFYSPEEISFQSPAAEKLYRLIYQRTLACGMTPLITKQTSVPIYGTTIDGKYEFRSSGSVVIDPGYTVAFGAVNSDSDDSDQDANHSLPPLLNGQDLQILNSTSTQHETQPPARYTEASLVQELEFLGVGRPSTFAGIVQILRDRAYVGSPPARDNNNNNNNRRQASSSSTTKGSAISAKRAAGFDVSGGAGSPRGPLVPSLSAFVVCSLLEKYCPTYVDPGFTSEMESRLDEIASGSYGMSTETSDAVDDVTEISDDDSDDIFIQPGNRIGGPDIAYLNDFYAGPTGLAATIKTVENIIDANVARRAELPNLTKPKQATANSYGDSDSDNDELGLFIGPWGPYVQKINGKTDSKSVTVPLPAEMAADLSTITLPALKSLLSTKEGGGIVLGVHPTDGRAIRLKTGRYGAFLQWGEEGAEGTTLHSIPKKLNVVQNLVIENEFDTGSDSLDADDDPSTSNTSTGLSLDQAVGYCSLPRDVTTLNDLPIIAGLGPYGPFLKYNEKYVSVVDDDIVTIDEERAKELVLDGIINKVKGIQSTRGALVEVGEKDGAMISVKRGRYGLYLNWKSVNAKLPAEYTETPNEVPIEVAWQAIQDKTDGSGKPSSSSSSSKKARSKDQAQTFQIPPPKRPLSSYFHFCSTMRAGLSNSGMSIGEVSKELGKRWSETSEEGRRPYQIMAAASKVEYDNKRIEWEEEMKTLDIPTENDSTASTTATKGKVKAKATTTTTKRKVKATTTTATKGKVKATTTTPATKGEVKGTKTTKTKSTTTVESESIIEQKVESLPVSSSSRQIVKQSKSAYMIFCDEKRPQVSLRCKTLGEVSKELSKMWIYASDRSVYEQLATKAASENVKR